MLRELTKLLVLHEGYRQKPYKDTVGKLTIGYGFNLDDVGLYPEECDFIIQNRIRRIAVELEKALPWVDDLDPVRTAVLLDMAYNMGIPTLLTFKKTLAKVKEGDYQTAASMMLQSKWAGQVGRRATRLSTMMRKGEWPSELA